MGRYIVIVITETFLNIWALSYSDGFGVFAALPLAFLSIILAVTKLGLFVSVRKSGPGIAFFGLLATAFNFFFVRVVLMQAINPFFYLDTYNEQGLDVVRAIAIIYLMTMFGILFLRSNKQSTSS